MTFNKKQLTKLLGTSHVSFADEGIDGNDVKGFIDTGSYMLNALFSGSIFKGIPSNKILALAGESSTGKCARGTETIEVYMTKETHEQLKAKNVL